MNRLCAVHRCAGMFAGLVLILTASIASAQSHEGDIFLDVHEGVIRTGAVIGGAPQVPVRVFETVLPPNNFISNPGFEALAGTFPAGSRVGWNATAGLRRWSGDQFDPAGGETLSISFFTSVVTVGDAPITGFDIAVQSDGGWHRHLGFLLSAAPGESAPAPGAYLLELEIYSTAPSIGTSDPMWLLLSRSASSEEMDAAAAFILAGLEEGPLCPADVDASGAVDLGDLLFVLAAWGACGAQACPADVTADGVVDLSDLLAVLAAWGTCAE